MASENSLTSCELILGNSNANFSGVTSTMLQTLDIQRNLMAVRVLSQHHLEDPALATGFWDIVRHCRTLLPDGRWRIFHARRNNEMIQALILRDVFGVKIKVVFTSTAQRRHSKLTRWLMSKMDAVISTCEAAASYLTFKPAAIIPHGIRVNHFHPPEDRKRLWHSLGYGGEFGIGIFGRVREQKGVHHFVSACIEVLPINPRFNAIIVGAISSGNQAFVSAQRKRIRAAGLENRVIFVGEQPFERIPLLFRSVSLVAALSNNEGFGLTALEAMASGAAVLATDAGAWKEVVRQNIDGCVVPADDGAAISKQLQLMLAQPKRLQEMGESGRQRVESYYTVEREARELCDFFRTLQKNG